MAWPAMYGLDSNFDINTLSSQPTVLLAHDLALTPAHFTQLRTELEASGFATLAPLLPSTGSRYTANVVENDTQTLFDTAAPVLRAGGNVVMVMSGYGGVPGSIAAERLNNWSLETPRAGRVVRAMHISSLLLDDGETVRSYMPARSNSLELLADRMCRYNLRERQNLFEPTSQRTVAAAMSTMQPFNSTALVTPVSGRAWTSIPSIYIICALDSALPSTTQETMGARLQEHGHHTSTVLRMQCGHTPFLTDVAILASILTRLASSQST